jgi:predicted nucleic acid-binding protein
MIAPVFVDANVFIYSRQANEPLKQPLAAEWIERLWKEQVGRTSLQVISETYVTMTCKIKPALASEVAWEYVRSLFTWGPQPLDAQVTQRARDIEQRYRLSWWDSLIVSAAQIQNCVLLLTEDLQDHAVYGSVTVRNPFKLSVSEAPAIYAAVARVSQRHRPRGRPKRLRQT